MSSIHKILFMLLATALLAMVNTEHKDFKNDGKNDDNLQVFFVEPTEGDESAKNETKTVLCGQEISHCADNANKIMLSLLMLDYNWDEIIVIKQERALNKLCANLGISKDHVIRNNANERDIKEMEKFALSKGNNFNKKGEFCGRLEFIIGCENDIFESCRTIADSLAQQVESNTISELTGLNFNSWAIWQKRVSNRVPRSKRDAVKEGSGEDDYEDYYEDEDDDTTKPTTPKPTNSELDAKVSHAHRHHHGIEKLDRFSINSNKESDALDRNIIDKTKILIDDAKNIEESVSELESDITKTIENNNEKVKEVQMELEKMINEEKEASSKISLGDVIKTIEEELPVLVVSTARPIDANVETIDLNNEKQVGSFDAKTIVDAIATSTTGGPIESFTKTDDVVSTRKHESDETDQRKTEGIDDVTSISSTTQESNKESTKVSLLTTPSTVTTFSSTELSSVTVTDVPILQSTTQSQQSVFSSSKSVKQISTTEQIATERSVDGIGITEKVEDDKPATTSKNIAESRNILPSENAVTENIDYDEKVYDDYEEKSSPTIRSTSADTTARVDTTTPITTVQTVPTTTPSPTTVPTTTDKIVTNEYNELESINNAPVIKSRLAKLPVTSGKPFSQIIPLETFFDAEDGFNLKLELLDKHDGPLDGKSWIQLNSEKREIYGLPLEDAVSKWQFKLKASDNGNESVTEHLDISVQQHKSYRSVNHEISIGIRLNQKFPRSVDWQLLLIQGIVTALRDSSSSSILVRDIRYSPSDPNSATFIYTNETLPKDKCPEGKLDELFQRLTIQDLSNAVGSPLTIKSITGKPIGPCSKSDTIKSSAPKPTQQMSKNYPPVPRNQVDRVNATVGHLLVFKVPLDTFYDPEDNTDLSLELLSIDRKELDPKHWLQFDTKNREFYGIPKYGDAGQREYYLVAKDREGLSAFDALVVVVGHSQHREYNMLFEFTLGMQFDDFNSSAVQRRFVERTLQVFNDPVLSNIQIRAIRKIHATGKTQVSFYNTTLHRPHHVCPTDEIETLRNILTYHDGKVRPQVNDIIGSEFDVHKINFVPIAACLKHGDDTHAVVPVKPDNPKGTSFKDDYLLTFALPAIIIVAMLLLACIIACVFHRRRLSGKMELGDEEERRSFRSKGIPVIFQDELDEKPELGNKSPIILKEEKPPLLPPSYNTSNPNDHEDMDEYIPPPAVVVSGKETRGKSPVMPSYRKPPPYVSP